MPIRVGMVSLGCSKNLVDSERMLFKLRKHGYTLVKEPGDADVVVVNTCGFIQSAKEEAIETILELAELKKEGTIQKIILTGCLTERYQEEVADQFAEVDAVVGIGDQKDIVSILESVLKKDRVVQFAPKSDAELMGDRIITTLPFYSYLKVAEGCSNRCSYCAIPKIRGPYRSVPMEAVLEEANRLAERGVTELIVIAQDTTQYGKDLYGESRLPQLLKALCEIPTVHWVRVLYCYPERITDELLDVMAAEEKIVKYLDIPIQHASDVVLKRMGRRTNEAELKEWIGKLRERIPDICLRTTLITGFPGETAEQHEELMQFVDEMEFDRLGVFTYSPEEDTPAAGMPEQIEEEVKEDRQAEIMELQQEIAFDKAEDMIGREVLVMIEGKVADENAYVGRTYRDAPNVDGLIFVNTDEELMTGDFAKVKVTGAAEYDLIGELI